MRGEPMETPGDNLVPLLKRLLAQEELSVEEWERLRVPPFTPAEVVQRGDRLRQVYPAIAAVCEQLPRGLETLWELWLPLALRLIALRQTLQRPIVQGILGGQGTGKTTLGKILTQILDTFGYQTLSLSLDDLYKTHTERLQLRDRDPRLIWRGPPGTHDVELGIQVLDALRHPTPNQPIAIPRFDKSRHNGAGDRREPEWVSPIDIVLFEGWFVGVRPIAPIAFDHAPDPIATAADRAFARDMNAQLHHYLPLWDRLDCLMVLSPVDYRLSQQWRKQAEQEMRSTGKPGMSDAEIAAFVEYFWRALHPELFIQPLVTNFDCMDEVVNGKNVEGVNVERVNVIVELRADHTIDRVRWKTTF